MLLLLCPKLALAALTITNVSPADPAFVKATPITVTATVTGATGTVSVKVDNGNGTSVDAISAGNVWTASNVPLAFEFTNDPNLVNTLTITAQDDDGPVTQVIHVTLDKTVPTVAITVPADSDPDTAGKQFTTGFASIDVSGTATDNDPNATLTVGAGFFPSPVTVDNGTWTDKHVTLSAGANTITATYRDRAGNVASDTITITRTTVCAQPDFPLPTGDPNDPKSFAVDRDDDLPDARPDDPNTCDVRPAFRDIPTDPNDAPFQPPAQVGSCTLRAAVQKANLHPGPDYIRLFGARKIVLTRSGAHEDQAARGDLDITSDTSIIGSARDSVVIDGKKLGDRVFDVAAGVRLQLIQLTVQAGHTPKPDKNNPNSVEAGGCIRSAGRLELNNVALLSCGSDQDGGALALEDGNAVVTCGVVARNQAKGNGGAISSANVPLTIRNSTLSLNSAGGRGGAVSIAGDDGSLDLILTNDTLSQNKSKASGGALDVGDMVDATINNLTFANNSAKAGSSISSSGSGAVSFSNTIFGDKSKSSCDPNSPEPVVSQGNNLELGDSCHLQTATLDDHPNTDPQLEPLATNNGTPTHKLKDTSPAVDAGGTVKACEDLDQRDVERGDWPGVAGDPNTAKATPPFCDIGALELRTAAPQ
ncbi:MAG TPA: choice-of-anchor Q domain-containing protein [Myxococcota bacterium]|nr:choice-of-anchor Q domain-containing protein [Myxococcota bacterium]